MKKSNFDGYMGARKDGSLVMTSKPTREESARGMKMGFDWDKEGMQQSYKTYKRTSDPEPAEVSKRLGRADERAAAAVQAAGRASDDELKRESRRGKPTGMANGGMVSGRSYGKKC
jgi:hypothetical protein